jgi:hypothetical protein
MAPSGGFEPIPSKRHARSSSRPRHDYRAESPSRTPLLANGTLSRVLDTLAMANDI